MKWKSTPSITTNLLNWNSPFKKLFFRFLSEGKTLINIGALSFAVSLRQPGEPELYSVFKNEIELNSTNVAK